MSGTLDIGRDERIDEIVLDAQKELTMLRDELKRSRVIFDSARLIVGHEFIKPLTSIKGYIELIEEELHDSISSRHMDYMQKVTESVHRMEELIGSIITMLHADNGFESEGGLESIDVPRTIMKIRKSFGQDGSKVRVEIGGGMKPVVLNRLCFEVVIENLISNSLKHGGDGVCVSVSTEIRKDRRGQGDRDLLLVAVEDDGPGIPKNRLDDVFNPFCRLEEGSNCQGLGLGLALVKSIVAIMKGEIHIKSEPGQGTRVTVCVPLRNEAQGRPEYVG